MPQQRWYVQVMGEMTGPFAWSELVKMSTNGRLSPGEMVKHHAGSWMVAASIPGLFDGAAAAVPVANDPAPATVPHGVPVFGRMPNAAPQVPRALQERAASLDIRSRPPDSNMTDESKSDPLALIVWALIIIGFVALAARFS